MKVWIFVEGRSDALGLSALLSRWKQELGKEGWGLQIIPLSSKSSFFRKIGPRAVEKLCHDGRDLVVGLPDLYPNREYVHTEYRHGDLAGLQDVQRRLVNRSLPQGSGRTANTYMARFFASALKHDMEVLLLAASDQLQARLRLQSPPRGWRRPPEDQNQERPPSKIVEDLFLKHLKRAYRKNTDSSAILRDANLQDVAEQCPTFRDMVDWIGLKTGVTAYSTTAPR